ncbi:bifunctional 23S rRNA (guanine(2069)-N(7))-methyltransferase RlmK/23S rRNA (guanine(2445)-N(2))-methyltransferase RlmL [Legionella sp. W05-934-2]|jgi:23S rRNA (guanine2445-N2)-methyltransferase / 23S rRNA (guanine2069-N7)-methyltransferase|uniref:bifunctional 23S rRNA (guanine(2069)-N(7))-methyltransferase RlmK/23S rRNA (guanine(2445)-N(2))-methyltransferase RlmL n=1 Tax=Legionella sp. W05-934-2 TaxID=1198649 RepID=UPI0034635949
MNYNVFVSCPRGLEYLLKDEVTSLGLHVDTVSPQGVYGYAPIGILYQLCLWSRIANRVQVILFSGQAHNQSALLQLCQQYHWQTVFNADKTFAVEFHGSSKEFRNTMFGAQVVKDGIVDYFARQGKRPSVDKQNPQIRLHAFIKQDEITISFDLTGYSLHQRGYRQRAGEAPIKENVAAAMLIRAQWPSLAKQGYSFHDPFCGSGTLVIEAAKMAANIAPGLLREDQAFIHWNQHNPTLWAKLRQQALTQVHRIEGAITGSDTNKALIKTAMDNAQRAGVKPMVRFLTQTVDKIENTHKAGLLIANPPYGERLGDMNALIPVYQQLGQTMAHQFQGWRAAILTSSPMLAKAIGLRSDKQYTLYNGPIECKLYLFQISDRNTLKSAQPDKLSDRAQMFYNRLKKNAQHLKKWAGRQAIDCYRVYDADLPDYAFAIDCYGDCVVVQEYAPPVTVPIHKAEQRSLEAMQVIPLVLDVPPGHIFVKQRRQQKGKQQYDKLSDKGKEVIVHEGDIQVKVNLTDYLDTGLFLDHRPMRKRLAKVAANKRLLNCFCYTGVASLHAAKAGAHTTNVDLSKTYLNWAKDNFRLNHLTFSDHQFIQADCLDWLKNTKEKYDVIFLDPPTFSNSKRMKDTFDVQRDHEATIIAAMRLLKEDGVLYFSTNLRKFSLSPQIIARYEVKNISKETIDEDFKRRANIHHCYELKRANKE